MKCFVPSCLIGFGLTLCATNNLVAQPFTTVITHGFDADIGEPLKAPWVISMANDIVARAGNTGTVLRYNPDNGEWFFADDYIGPINPNDPIILIFNWVDESDGVSIPGDNWGYTQAAADALYAALRDPSGVVPEGLNLLNKRTVHFIGHSRGACVNSEVTRRLALADITIDQVTTLDPHPVNGTLDFVFNWGDPIPQKWDIVTWADNYWRADGGGIPHAFDFDGMQLDFDQVENLSLYAVLGDNPPEDDDDTCLVPFCCFEHTKVHGWYQGSIDGVKNDGDCDIEQDSWYFPGANGYDYSAIGGAKRNGQSPGVVPTSVDILYNGSFDQGSYAGWRYHGGAGGIVDPAGVLTLKLIGNQYFARHNRFFLPSTAQTLNFWYDVSFASDNATLQVLLTNVDSGVEYLFDEEIPIDEANGWLPKSLTILPTVPRNEKYTLTFQIDEGVIPISIVHIDSIDITVSQPPKGEILFVDDDASSAGDGTSWDTAYKFLQDALAFAADPQNGVSEIRVGQGFYKPDRNAINPDGTGDRTATFEIIDGIALMGSYAGVGAPDPDERDIDAYETILSGDLNGDDGYGGGGTLGLTCAEAGPIFDGITTYEVSSSAIEVWYRYTASRTGSITISLCASNYDTMLWVYDGFDCPPTVTLAYDNNYCGPYGPSLVTLDVTAGQDYLIRIDGTLEGADIGAGSVSIGNPFENSYHVMSGSSLAPSTILDGLTIAGGNSNQDGGGVFVDAGSSLLLTNCTLRRNWAMSEGGGISAIGSSIIIYNCTFFANISGYFTECGYGGAVYADYLTVTSCFFDRNYSAYDGGAIYLDGSLTVWNSTFTNNGIGENGRGGAIECGTAAISGSVFIGNVAVDGDGGAIWSSGGMFVLNDCTFISNFGFYSGGAVACVSPSVTNCTFIDNGSVWLGGGGMFISSSADITGCTFRGNSAPVGAGIRLNCSSSNTVAESNFCENTPDDINCRRYNGRGNCFAESCTDDNGNDIPDDCESIGDLDGDGSVSTNDLLILFANWGICGDCNNCPADLDGDCSVSTSDLLILFANWG